MASSSPSSSKWFDLGVELKKGTSVDQVQELSRRSGQLEYQTVAWNETAIGRDGVRRLEKDVKATQTLLLATQGPKTPLHQLRRVTVIVDDPSEGQFLCGAIRSLKWAHLIAARPTSDKALSFLCESGDIDIISLDLGGRMAFQLSPKQAEKATSRGLVFEIRYAAAIEETSGQRRQQILSNISSVISATRGRGLIVCSGTNQAEHIRGPYDVTNLMVLLGLREEQARAALSSTCATVIGHAEARRLEWIPLQIERMDEKEEPVAAATAGVLVAGNEERTREPTQPSLSIEGGQVAASVLPSQPAITAALVAAAAVGGGGGGNGGNGGKKPKKKKKKQQQQQQQQQQQALQGQAGGGWSIMEVER